MDHRSDNFIYLRHITAKSKNIHMKNLVLSLAIVVFALGSVTAQNAAVEKKKNAPTASDQRKMIEEEKAAKALAENPNAPIIKFDKVVHDYGEIDQHADGNCEFKFTNEGKEPLILSNVRSSCGCTVPVWPRQPILPGQSDVIKVKYDTKRVGLINKSIQVYSNATQKTVVLKIKGKIHTPSTKMPEKNAENAGTPANK